MTDTLILATLDQITATLHGQLDGLRDLIGADLYAGLTDVMKIENAGLAAILAASGPYLSGAQTAWIVRVLHEQLGLLERERRRVEMNIAVDQGASLDDGRDH